MSRVTIGWTVLGICASGLAAAARGHPPGIIFVPFIFACWLIGAIVIELLSRMWRRTPSVSRAFVLLATTANLFVAVPASVFLMLESTTDRRFPATGAGLILFGPACLGATGLALFELNHRRRLIPIVVLCSLSIALVWLAVRDSDMLFLKTAIGVALFQGTAAVLLATRRLPG